MASGEEEDDGNGASGNNQPEPQQQNRGGQRPNSGRKPQQPAQAPIQPPAKYDWNKDTQFRDELSGLKPDGFLRKISFIREDQTFFDLQPEQVSRIKQDIESFKAKTAEHNTQTNKGQ